MRYATVCSGIEAPSIAWHPLGWRPQFFSEIEPLPCAVLKERWPEVPNYGDMRNFQHWPEHAIDLLAAGTPCQAFSLAGLRAGLADPRGNLTLTYLAIAQRYRPRWLVWENVPGVLSSWSDDPDSEKEVFADADGILWDRAQQRNDFDTFLAAMGQLGYGYAYRVLDAQYVRVESHPRAVPQRRRRVFVVGYLGDWRRAAAVLSERESMRGDPTPRRIKREDVARSLTASAGRRGGVGSGERDALVAEAFGGNNTAGPIDVATAVRAHGGSGHIDFESETFLAVPEVSSTLGGTGSSNGGGVRLDLETTGAYIPEVCGALNANGKAAGSCTQQDAESGMLVPEVAHPITAHEGKTYTHEGEGNFRMRNVVIFDETQITHPENRSQPAPEDPSHTLPANGRPPTIAFDCKAHGQGAHEELAPTLTAGGSGQGSRPNGGAPPAIAFKPAYYTRDQASGKADDVCFTLTATSGAGDAESLVCAKWRVRRLTPLECERLQGMPDNYTRVKMGKNYAKDGPRYKAIGNSWAVNCGRWIGRRIDLVESIK